MIEEMGAGEQKLRVKIILERRRHLFSCHFPRSFADTTICSLFRENILMAHGIFSSVHIGSQDESKILVYSVVCYEYKSA